ncbi:MAG TPA: hypothetical protein VGH46_00875 [Gaiellaceae bacterium]
MHPGAWYVTDRAGDHSTKPMGLLFPPRAFGCDLIAIVALTGFPDELSPRTKRTRTRRDAEQKTAGQRMSPECTTPADVNPRRLRATWFVTEWQAPLSP